MVAPPETTFAGSTIDDVAVVEPPHRGDDLMICAPVKMHEIVQQIFKMPPDERIRFLYELNSQLSLWKCYKA
jgi:hypothetical protein